MPARRAAARFASLGVVRLTEFSELISSEFGATTADSLLVDHVLTDLGGRTAAQALEAGVDPRDVWVALCRDFDVPRSRW
ncbi:hypothetical protein DFR67_11720 [Williamsia limnetica]|uniref:DUF3046 family protein n=1 Tax=Williamsia limnetica TaxID=882452 RepID=A0A318RDT8_WILLI|nr:hypothetical protein DFR67_11720 [Williamsia limnetica]